MSKIRAMHNHATSINAIAKMLNDNLKKIPFNGVEELALCDKDVVWVSNSNLAADIAKLIESINKTGANLLPQVILARSLTINPTQAGLTTGKFQNLTAIHFINEADNKDVMALAGQWFEYESPMQIVILTRSEFAARELSLHILNIINNYKTVKYDVVMTSEAGEKYRLKDTGEVKLINTKTATFSESTVPMSGIVAVATEINVKEEFFTLRDYNDIMTKWRIEDELGGATSHP